MKRFLNIFLVISVLIAAQVHAGSSCKETGANAENIAHAMDLALKTRQALDSSGAQVAFIARVGQDLSKYHLRYSHMAYVWRDHPKGRWLVVHELNQCGTAQSALYNQGLGNFFSDTMYAYEALVLIPSVDVQAQIVSMLSSDASLKLHSPQYNMVAYPFSTKYQNSNQWVLEAFAFANASDSEMDSRAKAQIWLKNVGYRPDTLSISGIERLGGRLFRANIAFDDHPFSRRMARKIDTVTVESMVRFIEKRDRGIKKMVVSLDGANANKNSTITH